MSVVRSRAQVLQGLTQKLLAETAEKGELRDMLEQEGRELQALQSQLQQQQQQACCPPQPPSLHCPARERFSLVPEGMWTQAVHAGHVRCNPGQALHADVPFRCMHIL